MKRTLLKTWVTTSALLALALTSQAVVIDFTGGTAYLQGGGTASPTDTGGYWSNVDYYIEDGIKIDFVGGDGIIGNYYGSFTPFTQNNSVIHNHWSGGGATSIVFSKADGSLLDLNYVDVTSNCITPGGVQTGAELSYITPAGGTALLLPSSDWGINYISTGAAGDGIKRLWLGTSFDQIGSFTVTSQNAYCFGLDNFYIDEPAPAPDGGTTVSLLGLAMFGLAALRRQLKST